MEILSWGDTVILERTFPCKSKSRISTGCCPGPATVTCTSVVAGFGNRLKAEPAPVSMTATTWLYSKHPISGFVPGGDGRGELSRSTTGLPARVPALMQGELEVRW